MAMIASNGAVDAPVEAVGREVRSEELEPSRSPAPRVEEVVDWI